MLKYIFLSILIYVVIVYHITDQRNRLYPLHFYPSHNEWMDGMYSRHIHHRVLRGSYGEARFVPALARIEKT